MDMNLRAVTLSPDTPLWTKLLPLLFVALIVLGMTTSVGHVGGDRGDVTSQVRPN